MQRGSGILFPIFSLPGRYGIGSFSAEAYHFIDFLAESRQKYWQILPLGPTGYGDSPYQPFSTFAGNPYFIDLENLIAQGLLTYEECDSVFLGASATDIDYAALYENRLPLLRMAAKRSRFEETEEYQAFAEANADWLSDYALFMAYKDSRNGESFLSWPDDMRNRNPVSLERERSRLTEEIRFHQFVQFEFLREWRGIKNYANFRGIQIIGDIPIYVAMDSSDFWKDPELFLVDETNTATAVGGCPPDAFSEDGQLWGSPLYNWEKMKKTGYDWWIRRIAKCRELYDIVRIDHFRGFESFYAIPYGEKTAKNGVWMPGPGMDLFTAVKKTLGDIPIIAEDLGFLTPEVKQLVEDSGYPGMKVLLFAFDDRDTAGPSAYMPCFYSNNCVAYTGTHDNETVMGYLATASENTRKNIARYLGLPAETVCESASDMTQELPAEMVCRGASDMTQEFSLKTVSERFEERNRELCDGLIRIAMASVADTVIIPLQDYLHKNNDWRINTPSTTGENWRIRYENGAFTGEDAAHIRNLTETYYRA